jgi:hypothetical protein
MMPLAQSRQTRTPDLRDHDDGSLSGPVSVYRLPSDDWEDAPQPATGARSMSMRIIERGSSACYLSVRAAQHLGAGSFRLRLNRRRRLLRIERDADGPWRVRMGPFGSAALRAWLLDAGFRPGLVPLRTAGPDALEADVPEPRT